MAQVSGTFLPGLIGTVIVAATACSQAPTTTVVAADTATRHERADRQARVPNEYLVTLAPEVKEGAINERFERYSVKDVRALGGDTYLMILVTDPGPGELLELIGGDSRFQAVQPNLIYWANRPNKNAK